MSPFPFRLAPLALALGVLTAGAAHAEAVLGLTTGGALVRFDSATPGTVSALTPITGFAAGQTLLGFDFRPEIRTVVAVSSGGMFYTVNPTTGVATLLSTLSGATLSGTSFGIDFNPTVDRLRIVSDTGQNLRVNVDTGVAFVDGPLNNADGSTVPTTGAVGAAYTNSVAGMRATTTQLFDISASTDTLYLQNPANSGTLAPVGALDVETNDLVGFDISGATGIAYASLGSGGTTGFYTVNLATGAASLVGAIGGGLLLADITVVPTAGDVPEPMTPALVLAALAAAALVRRRSAA